MKKGASMTTVRGVTEEELFWQTVMLKVYLDWQGTTALPRPPRQSSLKLLNIPQRLVQENAVLLHWIQPI